MSAPVRALKAGRQRGVALILAVLMVALAAILAVNVSFKFYLDQRRAATTFALEQAFEIGKGAEAWAAEILVEDAGSSKRDDLSEKWATPLPPLPIDGGEIQGQLLDLQGRFNLNSLLEQDPQNPQQVRVNQYAYQQLKRLLELLKLEEEWADKIVDWIDPDNNPIGSNGAEDPIYTAQTPPYRAANTGMTRVSELLNLPGFGIERYRVLAPHVAALPANVNVINVCTATPYVLDSMLGNQTNFSLSIEAVAKARQNGCFPDKDTFQRELESAHTGDQAARQHFISRIGEQSNFFEADIWITIGTTQFTLYSQLLRDRNSVGVYARSFGTR
jgi:general secretion pathway protein K